MSQTVKFRLEVMLMWFCTTKCMWLYKNICTMCMARVEEEKDNGTFVSGVRDGIRARISLLQDLFLLLAKWPLRFWQTSTSLEKYINSLKVQPCSYVAIRQWLDDHWPTLVCLCTPQMFGHRRSACLTESCQSKPTLNRPLLPLRL